MKTNYGDILARYFQEIPDPPDNKPEQVSTGLLSKKKSSKPDDDIDPIKRPLYDAALYYTNIRKARQQLAERKKNNGTE